MIDPNDDARMWKEFRKSRKERLELVREQRDIFKGLVPKHLKTKKDIPTVIEYQGRRYILDDPHNRK